MLVPVVGVRVVDVGVAHRLVPVRVAVRLMDTMQVEP